jgi:hypothetical protein
VIQCFAEETLEIGGLPEFSKPVGILAKWRSGKTSKIDSDSKAPRREVSATILFLICESD